jgi:hypothetical protein
VDFSLSQTLPHWSFECEEGSIPFTRSTHTPFSLNGLQLQWRSKASDFHNGFNVRYGVKVCLRSKLLMLQ